MCKRTYVYGFVRKDIPHVNQIIQFGHAMIELGKRSNYKPEEPSNFVLFEVSSEEELMKIDAKLWRQFPEHSYSLFYEDAYPKGHTALAIGPFDEDDPRREIFRGYLMYREHEPLIFTGV